MPVPKIGNRIDPRDQHLAKETPMKIEGSAFSVTGKDNDRHSIGTVLIEFSDQQVATFDDVREDKFENWVASDYDPDLVPVDMCEAW
jgi:hypothetical protein